MSTLSYCCWPWPWSLRSSSECSFHRNARKRNVLCHGVSGVNDRLLAWQCRLSICRSVCLWRGALSLNDTSYYTKSVWQVTRTTHPHEHDFTTFNLRSKFPTPKISRFKLSTSGIAQLHVGQPCNCTAILDNTVRSAFLSNSWVFLFRPTRSMPPASAC